MMKLNKKGFTLVELLAVIVILALLMVVAASAVGSAQENSKKSALSTEAQKIYNGISSEAKAFALIGEWTAADITKTYPGTDGTDFKYDVDLSQYGEITSFVICYQDKYYVTYDTTNKKFSTVTEMPKKEEDGKTVIDDKCANPGVEIK